jgi:hypothetical protein
MYVPSFIYIIVHQIIVNVMIISIWFRFIFENFNRGLGAGKRSLPYMVNNMY